MIKYVKGDLLEAPQRILVHQVNCQGVMGSGAAKAIRERYPQVYRQYALFYKEFRLGEVQLVRVEDKIIANLFGQDDYLPRGIKHTRYEALEEGFLFLKSTYTVWDIAMPKIGCGLGGGDWGLVEAMLEAIFTDREIYVYEL